MRTTTLTIFGILAVNLTIAGQAASAVPVVVAGGPVAALPGVPGTGLCMASSVSMNPAFDFSQSLATFNSSVNDFMEAHKNAQVSSVLRVPFDLSNNNVAGASAPSYGDFIDAVAGCASGGCDFAYNDAVTSFASRLRGYLDVSEPLVNKPIHFGMYLDDAASLTIFDKNQAQYSVITVAPQLGASAWRSTNTVTFQEAGLYPIEILYAEFVEDAALEVSYSAGDFADFELPKYNPSGKDLKAFGFTLFDPSAFHQTINGGPSFPDLSACTQCDRQFADIPGNSGCAAGMYCNSAAVCAPCSTDVFCGPTCSPCAGAEPFCADVNGAFACVACVIDAHCGDGGVCEGNQCIGGGGGGAGGNGVGGGATTGAGGSQGGGDSGGCACRASVGSEGGGLAALVAGALVAGLRRFRRRGASSRNGDV